MQDLIKELMEYLENFRIKNPSQTFSWEKLEKIGFNDFNLRDNLQYKKYFRHLYPHIIYNGQYGFTLVNKDYYEN